MDTLGIEPRASRVMSGCDTTTPCALMRAGFGCFRGRARPRGRARRGWLRGGPGLPRSPPRRLPARLLGAGWRLGKLQGNEHCGLGGVLELQPQNNSAPLEARLAAREAGPGRRGGNSCASRRLALWPGGCIWRHGIGQRRSRCLNRHPQTVVLPRVLYSSLPRPSASPARGARGLAMTARGAVRSRRAATGKLGPFVHCSPPKAGTWKSDLKGLFLATASRENATTPWIHWALTPGLPAC